MRKYENFTNIYYYKNNESISIDDNMIKVASYVESKYFLWLGDDDYLVENGLSKILNYLENKDYDFVLLSATRVSEDLTQKIGCNLETSLKNIYLTENVEYESPKEFFLKHCFHMPFGTLIVKKELYDSVLNENKRFRGTSHAYSGLIFDYLAKKHLLTSMVNILLVREELIMLRQIEKTWKSTATKIMMHEIPEWFSLFDEYYKSEVKQILNYYLNMQFNLKSLIGRRINDQISFKEYKILTKYASKTDKIKYLLACVVPVLRKNNNAKQISKYFNTCL